MPIAHSRPTHIDLLLVVGFVCLAVSPTDAQGTPRAPKAPSAFDWQTALPERHGMSSKMLEALREALAAKKTKAFIIIRNDCIIFEWYAAEHGATVKHYIASVSKPVVGALALALLLGDGRLKLDDVVARFVPHWADDPRKSRITLRHLGSHTSGLEDAHMDGVSHDKLTGWKGDFWKRHDPPNDPFTLARDKAPILFEPGHKMHYSNPGIAMLGYAITAALKDSPHKDIRTLLRERVMRPIGVADQEWSIGYGKTFQVDGLPLVAPWGGGSYTARALARVGRLMLRGGDWQGKPILTKDSVRLITSDAGTPGHCGVAWWSNNDGKYPKLPRDAVWGSGAGHQVVLVIPSLNLIAVRQGESLSAKLDHHDALNEFLFQPLLDAVADKASGRTGQAPYPPSKTITGIDWAAKDTILRYAKGSDNWPLTWADDDLLYTAYGDGWGFEPKVPKKLGLGFARIEGEPPHLKGINIRSATGEQIGDGARAKKASGMLMVDGILYLWTRNAGNAQLAWSADHGKTWTWSDWKFTTSFGCPTFLNFGKNYAGARDDYVYVYSHDGDSAYEPADRMVLARVPKDRIRDRAKYEFFHHLTAKGPVWVQDVSLRGAVFKNQGQCYRSGITYNPGLKRYLWCQTLPGGDARFAGGFGIYDAPEPWGPWATVFFTDKWDVGPGETSSLPTKWMSPDGLSAYLVFSGDDAFSVRRVTFQIRRP